MGINALGIGSGVLTADVIDQLKAADESILLNPIDKRIVANKTKSASLVSIETLLNALKSSLSDLVDSAPYSSRSVTMNGSGFEITANDNVAEQTFTLSTTSLAKKAVMESSAAGAFTSGGDTIAAPGSSGTYTVTVDGTTYNIAYDDTTTLDQLIEKINTTAGSKVTASKVQVASGDVRLILTSNTTGAGQSITTDDLDGGLAGKGLTTAEGLIEVQKASDASFVYNGIPITRSSNEITDLISGVSITLQQEGASSSVSIAQNKDDIIARLQSFVDTYNNVITQVGNLTKAGGEGETAGVFSGDNFVNSIARSLSGLVTGRLQDGTSLITYGFTVDKTGKLSFNSTTFLEQLKADPEKTELVLSGDATTKGIFDRIDTQVRTFVSYQGLIDNYDSGLTSKLENLEKQRERVSRMLQTRYEIMAKQFAAYDAAISKVNANFNVLQQQILAAQNMNNN